jgi:predicted RNA binding protein YcfA (HicA-like mRNA interferase family)
VSPLPAVKPRQVVAALQRIGFVEHYQKGSHLYMWQPQLRRMTCVPQHAGDIKKGTLRAIIKQAGMTEEQFHELR